MCLDNLKDKKEFIAKAEKAKRGYIYAYSTAVKRQDDKYWPVFNCKEPYKDGWNVSECKEEIEVRDSADEYIPYFHRYIYKQTARKRIKGWKQRIVFKWLVPIKDITAAGMNGGRTIVCRRCYLIGEV